MIRLPYQALIALILLASSDFSLADGNTYGQYMSQLTQQQKDVKPLTNSQFFVANATNRANRAITKGISGNNHRIIQGTTDGGASVDSVNIGPNAKLNNATIIVKSDHSNSTIVNKAAANR
ncbi:hypothetical protein [Paraburkholderia azotifigens]|uniref:DUF4148 domain-containing protein n=1 Tax=Paraburkholderia azotifigens TaxID=2057004 RepID=A0A5C6VGJ5_9BURK|nr:hypothetical protein [Paraburkholderia azotifigens]TXC84502.1 hypothetical protein FRZ40_29980 [Paraburkholderia azotifigens]